MNTEQERAFIEWRTNHDPRKYPAERDAFMAGWDAGRAALQSQDAEDDFIDGVLLGLQVITGAGNAGSAEHNELMRSAGVDLVVRRAIEQEMWELAGLDRNQISITARRRIEGERNARSLD